MTIGDANPAARLLSIQVGLPRRLGGTGPSGATDRPWRSGYVKEPVSGSIWLGRTNLVGDGQGNLKVHGGPEQAVLAYAAAHYPRWRGELGRPDFPHGAFAENFTVAGLDEETVCIGDTFAVGDTEIQVSQPRQPCANISRRWGIADLTARVQATGRTGWYLRVLKEGNVASGLPVVLLDRPCPDWTIARTHRVMQGRRRDRGAAAELAACPFLSPRWRAVLAEAVASDHTQP